MLFLTPNDFLGQISREDLDTLLEEQPQPEPEPVDPEVEPTGDEPAPEPEPTIIELAERNAMAEVASYLRGRYDMEAAFSLSGMLRNAQLVMIVVDVALWHLLPRVTFRMVSEVRETRYNAALKWLKLAQDGKSNPDLPRYAPSSGTSTQRNNLFRYGSQPARSHNF
ncbi:hypothetical protein GCM10023185_15430 [Hymenobacter saemangeumensis]|uniref:DUF1320 domain-containing protein n=1 Tax=Hymenobacter saemangeumensis TaxID=1084522 RepID=A0ABP8I992_9BACT